MTKRFEIDHDRSATGAFSDEQRAKMIDILWFACRAYDDDLHGPEYVDEVLDEIFVVLDSKEIK